MSRLKEISDWWKPDVIMPEKVKKFIDMYPVYRNDVDCPAFKSRKEILERMLVFFDSVVCVRCLPESSTEFFYHSASDP